jgi:hypothetical protein
MDYQFNYGESRHSQTDEFCKNLEEYLSSLVTGVWMENMSRDFRWRKICLRLKKAWSSSLWSLRNKCDKYNEATAFGVRMLGATTCFVSDSAPIEACRTLWVDSAQNLTHGVHPLPTSNPSLRLRANRNYPRVVSLAIH